jgi:hypothetical protein
MVRIGLGCMMELGEGRFDIDIPRFLRRSRAGLTCYFRGMINGVLQRFCCRNLSSIKYGY